MPQFYELVLRGSAHGQLVINSLWYKREVIGGTPPVEADLTALRNRFAAEVQPVWLQCHTTDYRLDQIDVYGYSDTFERSPYLPLIYPESALGTAPGTSAPLYVVALISFRVTPMRPWITQVSGEPAQTGPVRRGYLSLSPIPQAMVLEPGTLDLAPLGLSAGALLTDLTQDLDYDPGDPTQPDFQPVRVSAAGREVQQRGYADIESAQWRPYGSTRRSRMFGKGA